MTGQVGLTPWFPWPLNRWRWLNEAIPAERLAAVRVGVGLVLLLDVLCTYLPAVGDFYGPEGVGGPGRVSASSPPPASWSVLAWCDSLPVLQAAGVLRVVAAAG